MQQLGLDLIEHESEVLRLFREVLSEPPLQLPPDHDVGDLPLILHELVEVSLLHPHELAAHEQKIAKAVQYGEARRAGGFEERLIFQEFAAVREALRRYVSSCPVPRWKRREALMRLDMALSVAELAAMRGYHRAAFEKAGLWGTLLGSLAKQSPLLGLPDPSKRVAPL